VMVRDLEDPSLNKVTKHVTPLFSI
jgi:hypothetical protein